ncbi:DeoR/GlpR family transcriptional regulator of sugar metabolism [Hydrogenivirga caldilitoris]|uniref:DeoR/GlpR family transcriptional regulator of sugar metabolism n=1 Tax=Hydrogenivirga caldilitoris TaxID=246264 RepID=A0A497XMV5_9AQUI|nr:DeoR family transcriptional regulator [Hydrogenivirga caldilitoris]RLJ70245.1 DeoR/GlpR family transcriptional regulator of sugar metabolism [Hydrogenivirga caldilitoris]
MGRKEEIVRLVEEGYKTAKELARHFNVSLMTIYRDLKELEEEGVIIRRHGNIELKREESLRESVCAVCGKEVDLRLAFIYILQGGRKVHTCCAHCGLIAYKTLPTDKVEMAITRDFITCNPINAFTGTFVVGSMANSCCTPSAFVFADKEYAQRFAKGFGGYVSDFVDAVVKMEELMKAGQRVNLSL